MSKRRRHTPDQIIRKLAEGNKRLAGGAELDEVARHLEIAESTWHRWVAQYGGMKASDAKRLKELEGENARLKKLTAPGMPGGRPASLHPTPGPAGPRRGGRTAAGLATGVLRRTASVGGVRPSRPVGRAGWSTTSASSACGGTRASGCPTAS